MPVYAEIEGGKVVNIIVSTLDEVKDKDGTYIDITNIKDRPGIGWSFGEEKEGFVKPIYNKNKDSIKSSNNGNIAGAARRIRRAKRLAYTEFDRNLLKLLR